MSRHVFQDYYSPYTKGSVYLLVHKAYKMNLLERNKLYGNMYEYRVSDWGVRYLEEREEFRNDKIYIKLLGYILKSGDKAEELWAYTSLAPRILRRFLPFKRSQNIDPSGDIHEAALKSIEVLKRRIQDETYIHDEDLYLNSTDDYLSLFYVDMLNRKLFPRSYEPLDFKQLKEDRTYVIEESLEEIENPPKYILIRSFGLSALDKNKLSIHLKDRPHTEHKPNRRDRARLQKVVKKLEKLLIKEFDRGETFTKFSQSRTL